MVVGFLPVDEAAPANTPLDRTAGASRAVWIEGSWSARGRSAAGR